MSVWWKKSWCRRLVRVLRLDSLQPVETTKKARRAASSYRSARRNLARERKLAWRQLPRVRWNNGVLVLVLV